MDHYYNRFTLLLAVSFIFMIIGISSIVPNARTLGNYPLVKVSSTTNTQFEQSDNYNEKHYLLITSTNESIDTQDLIVERNGSLYTINHKGSTIAELYFYIKSQASSISYTLIIDTTNEEYKDYETFGYVNLPKATYDLDVIVSEGTIDDVSFAIGNSKTIDARPAVIKGIIILSISSFVFFYSLYRFLINFRGTTHTKGTYDIEAAFKRKNKRTYGTSKLNKDDDPFETDDPFKNIN